MEKINQLKLYFKANPLMGFVAAIALVTIFLGIGAYIGTRPQTTADKTTETPTPTPEEDSQEDEFSGGADDIDTTESEHKAAIPTATETEGNITATPTKAATSPTAAPTNTPVVNKINLNLLGDIYEDLNCNGTRDSGENLLTKTATINLYKMPEFSAYKSLSTDSSSHYSYSDSIGQDETLKLQATAVSPEGYKANPKFEPPTVTFNKDSQNSQRVDIPQVPNDKVSACQ